MQSFAKFIFHFVQNWYIVVFIMAFIVQLINSFSKQAQKKELLKRKEILTEIDTLKEKYKKGTKNGPFQSDLINAQLDENQEETRAFNKEAKEIVKKHNGKPLLIVIPFLVYTFLFAFAFFSLKEINEIEYSYYMPVLTSILTFLNSMTRKSWWISLALSAFGFYVYLHLNAILVLFLLFYNLVSSVIKIGEIFLRKSKK